MANIGHFGLLLHCPVLMFKVMKYRILLSLMEVQSSALNVTDLLKNKEGRKWTGPTPYTNCQIAKKTEDDRYITIGSALETMKGRQNTKLLIKLPVRQPFKKYEISKKLTLPNFSDYVIARLNSNDSHYCWNKMIEEAAYYYMGKHPSIGKDNGTGDYKTIGQKLVQTYPSIERPGAQPWSCFTKALSQKIRTIRHNEKTKSTYMTVPQSLSNSSPKQFNMKRGACIMNTHSDIDEHYDEHVEEMKKEFTKQKPD